MPLPIPGKCSLQLVDEVVAERQAGKNAVFFTGISAEWKLKVNQYIENFGSPESTPKWPAIGFKSNSFLNLYLAPQENSVQGVMLADLRSHKLNLCPSCGEAGRPNTLDHYLPKASYPHFCITPVNLFPMCDACQTEKGNKTGNALEPRFFIHPYFDIFAVENVVELQINAPYDTPTFDLAPSLNLDVARRRLVASHIRELAIPRRYGHFFRGQYIRLLRLVRKMRDSGQEIVPTLENFRLTFSHPSVNSWEHIFYDAALRNDELIAYLKDDLLPTNL